MAVATNTNTAGIVAPKPPVVSGAPTEPIVTGLETVDPNATGKGEDDAAASAGIDVWTIFWLAVGFAVFVFLWKRGIIASFRKFIAETREQLYKSTWPTADELKQHIVVVMIVTSYAIVMSLSNSSRMKCSLAPAILGWS